MAANAKLFYCDQIGHWKRNFPNYLKDKKFGASSSAIYVIDINLATSTSSVFDTGCISDIISNVKGLRRSRTLARGEVQLRVGNGARVTAVAFGTYSLPLPFGLKLELTLVERNGRAAVKTSLRVAFLSSSPSLKVKGCILGPKPQPFHIGRAAVLGLKRNPSLQRAAVLTITATLLTQNKKRNGNFLLLNISRKIKKRINKQTKRNYLLPPFLFTRYTFHYGKFHITCYTSFLGNKFSLSLSSHMDPFSFYSLPLSSPKIA